MEKQNNKPVQIKINGTIIPLNAFVKEVIYNVIIGLVSSLKLRDEPETVEITIKK